MKLHCIAQYAFIAHGQQNGEKGRLQAGKTSPSPLIHILCPYAGLGTYMYMALVL